MAQTEYVNDLLPKSVVIEIQGMSLIADPDAFSVEHEIRIRQAFQDEADLLATSDNTNRNSVLLESRKIILAAGLDIIPEVCDIEPEAVSRLSVQAIGSILAFFLGSAWRDVELVTGRELPRTTKILTNSTDLVSTPAIRRSPRARAET